MKKIKSLSQTTDARLMLGAALAEIKINGHSKSEIHRTGFVMKQGDNGLVIEPVVLLRSDNLLCMRINRYNPECSVTFLDEDGFMHIRQGHFSIKERIGDESFAVFETQKTIDRMHLQA